MVIRLVSFIVYKKHVLPHLFKLHESMQQNFGVLYLCVIKVKIYGALCNINLVLCSLTALFDTYRMVFIGILLRHPSHMLVTIIDQIYKHLRWQQLSLCLTQSNIDFIILRHFMVTCATVLHHHSIFSHVHVAVLHDIPIIINVQKQ